MWEVFSTGKHWRLADKAREILTQVASHNIRIAILSNNDSRLRSVLDDLQMIDLFEEIFISSEIGYEKPELEIFRTVEKRMDETPDGFLHLGDSYSRDYLGARQAGWQACLYGSKSGEEKEITHFEELPTILGI